jgi:hypothetical protein
MPALRAMTAYMMLILLINACQTPDGVTTAKGQEGRTATLVEAPLNHELLVIGKGPVYAAFLPHFSQTQSYQAVLEVELRKAGTDLAALYVQDRRQTGETVYTIASERFPLMELFGPGGGAPQRSTFRATLFRGSPGGGGSPIAANITVKVKRVILARRIGEDPVMPTLSAFLFGNQHELFAVHAANGASDFEQVTSVKVVSGAPTAVQAAAILSGGVVDFPGVANEASQALQENREYDGRVKIGPEEVDIRVRVGEDLYFDKGTSAP